jgi:2'-5' RNA ligase
MRPLAIELSFDPTSDERLRRMWSQLSVLYGGAKDSELGVRPHITLVIFRNDDPGNALPVIEALAAKLSSFTLDLSTADFFETSEGVVFLQPEPSADLARAHAILYKLLDKDRHLIDPYYQPGAWHPHCTMATGVPKPLMEHVLSACRSPEALGEVQVVRIQLVRYRPATEISRVSLEESNTV